MQSWRIKEDIMKRGCSRVTDTNDKHGCVVQIFPNEDSNEHVVILSPLSLSDLPHHTPVSWHRLLSTTVPSTVNLTSSDLTSILATRVPRVLKIQMVCVEMFQVEETLEGKVCVCVCASWSSSRMFVSQDGDGN
ncbi:hypothetical protein ILYODFUR_023053 [Ilyodon furcidens]|uniref:Uncharacterized protein n=1 Tax=Ilyodon furcidens TaxID=33524 RepID=A0ABV0SZC9_9TELE